jgi:hypothetical protein
MNSGSSGLSDGAPITLYPHGIDNGAQELAFPALSGPATGLSGLSGSNIPLQPGYGLVDTDGNGEEDTLVISTKDDIDDTNGNITADGGTIIGTFTVANGELDFTVKNYTELNKLGPALISDWIKSTSPSSYRDEFGYTGSGNEVAISDPDATMLRMTSMYYDDEEDDEHIDRSVEIREETFAKASDISYIWVDRDCTLSRGAKTMSFPDGKENGGDYHGETVEFSAFELPLKAGWNLVQMNRYQYGNEGKNRIITVKIADRDVPWTVGFSH